MLNKTIDLVVKYAILKMYQEKNIENKIINEGLRFLEGKIQAEIKSDKPRMKQVEKDRERIRKKKERPR